MSEQRLASDWGEIEDSSEQTLTMPLRSRSMNRHRFSVST